MKKVIIIILAGLFYLDGYCQEYHPQAQIDFSTESHYYQGKYEVDSISKKELFKRAKMFFVQNYKGGENVINSMDEELGYILAKGALTLQNSRLIHSVNWLIKYDVEVFVKDGAYKFTIKNFTYVFVDQYGTHSGKFPIDWVRTDLRGEWKKEVTASFIKQVYDIIFSLDIAMNQGISNDW